MPILTSGPLDGMRILAFGVPHTQIGMAVLVAVLSTSCYATGAVLQQRQAHTQGDHATAVKLLGSLVTRARWWLAIGMTAAGALLHILALRLGSLTIVQPLGVLTLVLAVPLGAHMDRRTVTWAEWRGAAAVVAGLVALLSVSPHHRRPPPLPSPVVLALCALTAGLVLWLLLIAAHLPRQRGAVAVASAAGICLGSASAMARLALTSAVAPLLTAPLAVLAAAAGLALTQLAYRDGGLGAPLATLTLSDPLTAVIIAVTVFDESIELTPTRATLGLAGLAATTLGIAVLTRTRTPQPTRI